jgi:hypothetical protein
LHWTSPTSSAGKRERNDCLSTWDPQHCNNTQLRDGETQILAGLISDADRESATSSPGLGTSQSSGVCSPSRYGSAKDRDRNADHAAHVDSISPSHSRRSPVGTDASIGSAPVRINATAPGSLTMAPVVRSPELFSAAPAGQPCCTSHRAPPQPVRVAARITGSARCAEPGCDAAPTEFGWRHSVVVCSSGRESGNEIISLSLAPEEARCVQPPISVTTRSRWNPLARYFFARTSGLTYRRLCGMRFKVLTTAGRAQVRVDNVVGVDPVGMTVPVQGPGRWISRLRRDRKRTVMVKKRQKA